VQQRSQPAPAGPPPEQPPGALPAALTLFVGLGRRGSRVVAGLGAHVPFGPQDEDPRRHLGRLALEGGAAEPATAPAGAELAARILERLQQMLQHGSVDDARQREAASQVRSQATKALVVLLADLGEPALRGQLPELLAALEDQAARHLAPIVGQHRQAQERNLALLPLCTLPQVDSAPDGEQIAACLAGLRRQIAERAPARRMVGSLYLLQDVTDLSLLTSEDLDAMLESAGLLLAEAIAAGGEPAEGAAPALPFGAGTLEQVLWGSQPRDPLGTLTLARSESGAAALRELLLTSHGLRVLQALRDVASESEGLAGRQELRAAVADALARRPPPTLRDRTHALVRNLAPSRPADPPWQDFKEQVLAAYGPDAGDPASDAPAPPCPDRGWLAATGGRILAGWRDLTEQAFDGIVEEFRAELGAWEQGSAEQPALAELLRREVDGVLLPGGRPTLRSHAQAVLRADALHEHLRRELSASVAQRDALRPEGDPSLGPLRSAHAALLDATRALPPLRPLALGTTLVMVLLTGIGGTFLQALAGRLALAPGGLAEVSLQRFPFATAGFLALLLVGLPMALFYRRRWDRARRALDALWQQAEDLVLGATGSLASFFLGRLEHAWQVAHAGVLWRCCQGMERDLERLRSVDRAVAGAIERRRQRLAALGLSPEGQPLPSRPGGRAPSPLVWPLLRPEQLAPRLVAEPALDADALLALVEVQSQAYARWRAALPYLEDEPLDRALEQTLAHRLPAPPWLAGEWAEEARRELARFAAAQARSLPLGLPFAAQRHQDLDGCVQVADGLLLPPGLQSLWQATPSSQPTSLLGERALGARAYALRLYNGISHRSLPWWAPEPAPQQPPAAGEAP